MSKPKKEVNSLIEELKQLIVQSIDDNKGEDIEVIDLSTKTDIASYMILATGRVDRHIKSVADNLTKKLKEFGQDFIVEGMDQKDWVLIDAFDIIVHILKKETRESLDLESLWKK